MKSLDIDVLAKELGSKSFSEILNAMEQHFEETGELPEWVKKLEAEECSDNFECIEQPDGSLSLVVDDAVLIEALGKAALQRLTAGGKDGAIAQARQ